MPSNIEGKLYLGDILLCAGGGGPTPVQECVGRYGVSNSCVVGFGSIIYNQYYNNALFESNVATTISYKQLYVYSSGLV